MLEPQDDPLNDHPKCASISKWTDSVFSERSWSLIAKLSKLRNVITQLMLYRNWNVPDFTFAIERGKNNTLAQ